MRKTVIITGAGASLDFGLPLGSDLVRTIRDEMVNEIADPSARPIHDSAMTGGLVGDFGAAARDIAGGLVTSRSIDRFLDSRKDQPLVIALGKRAIVKAIADAEDRSLLSSGALITWEQRQAAFQALRDTWLANLFAILQEGVSPAESSTVFKEVGFITFNYDRTIEQYLRLAFQHAMARPEQTAHSIVKQIPILHVYGSLGELTTQAAVDIPFGARGAIYPLLNSAEQRVRTFTESHDSATLSACHELIEQAQQIVFIGFAFDRLNLEALFPKPVAEGKVITGTALGVGPKEKFSFVDLALGTQMNIEHEFNNRFYTNETGLNYTRGFAFRGLLDR